MNPAQPTQPDPNLPAQPGSIISPSTSSPTTVPPDIPSVVNLPTTPLSEPFTTPTTPAVSPATAQPAPATPVTQPPTPQPIASAEPPLPTLVAPTQPVTSVTPVLTPAAIASSATPITPVVESQVPLAESAAASTRKRPPLVLLGAYAAIIIIVGSLFILLNGSRDPAKTSTKPKPLSDVQIATTATAGYEADNSLTTQAQAAGIEGNISYIKAIDPTSWVTVSYTWVKQGASSQTDFGLTTTGQQGLQQINQATGASVSHAATVHFKGSDGQHHGLPCVKVSAAIDSSTSTGYRCATSFGKRQSLVFQVNATTTTAATADSQASAALHVFAKATTLHF